MNYSLKKKIAQMLLVGIPNKDSIDGVIRLIRDYGIGGVILYKNNYANLEELKSLILKLKSANLGNELPLTIAIDQEGGRVNRLPKELVNSYSLNKMSKGSGEDISTFANVTSKLLFDLGINMNFAPVLDLKMQDDGKAIGDRAISSDFNKVTEVANLIVGEFNKNNVVSVIKHFPGQGSVNMDSHFLLPIVFNYNKLLKSDVIPFENLIKKDISAVMVGHMLVVGKTKMLPASISGEFIDNELRRRLSYDNIVMTDEMGMRSVSYLYGKKGSVVKAFMAKNDIICCKYSDNYIESIIDRVEKNINEGKIKIKDIDNSIYRIKRMKSNFKFSDEVNFDNLDIDYYNKTLDELKKRLNN